MFSQAIRLLLGRGPHWSPQTSIFYPLNYFWNHMFYHRREFCRTNLYGLRVRTTSIKGRGGLCNQPIQRFRFILSGLGQKYHLYWHFFVLFGNQIFLCQILWRSHVFLRLDWIWLRVGLLLSGQIYLYLVLISLFPVINHWRMFSNQGEKLWWGPWILSLVMIQPLNLIF